MSQYLFNSHGNLRIIKLSIDYGSIEWKKTIKDSNAQTFAINYIISILNDFAYILQFLGIEILFVLLLHVLIRFVHQ